jgi:hypothetical protein
VSWAERGSRGRVGVFEARVDQLGVHRHGRAPSIERPPLGREKDNPLQEPFQFPNALFAIVQSDEVGEGVSRPGKNESVPETQLGQNLGQHKPRGDLNFFGLGVAIQSLDLHAVYQRPMMRPLSLPVRTNSTSLKSVSPA